MQHASTDDSSRPASPPTDGGTPSTATPSPSVPGQPPPPQPLRVESSAPGQDKLAPAFASRGVSLGAVAAVLFTLFGAIVLTFVFGQIVTATTAGVTPVDATKADLNVSWSSTESWNKRGSRRSTSTVASRHGRFYVVPASRSELCFDSITDAAEWPPDLDGDGYLGAEAGLRSFTIDVEIADPVLGSRSVKASYLVRTDEHEQFLVLVPMDSPPEKPEGYFGRRIFEASAKGVCELAKSEQDPDAR